MTGLAAVSASDVRSIVSGGREALAALTDRVGSGDANMLFELYQIADVPMLDAMSSATRAGRQLDVLADARLAGGGVQPLLLQQVAASGGTLHTFGAPGEELFQHGKSFHFTTPKGPESWITNLAPIPDTNTRTEISLVLRGDAARAAQQVTSAAHHVDVAGSQAAIDAALSHGLLVNDPTVDRRVLSHAVRDLLGRQSHQRDLLVVTKGLAHSESTSALIAAHRSGRDVQVFVRDIARDDAERLADAHVPTWVMSGGLKQRVNAVFAGDRGVLGSAFLWKNMVGTKAEATSRDVGVLVDGAIGASVRSAALVSARGARHLTPIREAVSAGDLPEHI